MALRKLAVAWITLLLTMFTSMTLGEELTLGLAQNEAVQDVAAELLSEIYRRAGLTPKIEPLPPARIT